jgi:uncharacterized membrane protein
MDAKAAIERKPSQMGWLANHTEGGGSMNKRIELIWGFLFLTLVGYLLFIGNVLPERLAVHFDIAGKPNGFQNKSDFIIQFCCFTFIINGLFLALSWGIAHMPPGIISIPWKRYWFATEERKVQAFERLRAVLALGGIFICSIFLFLEQVIYRANTKDPLFSIPANGGVLAVFILSVFFIVLCFIITKPPSEG